MKSFFHSLVFTGISLSIHAQDLPAFRPLRYEEDYSRINTDSALSSHSSYARLKHLSPGRHDVYLSIGGSVRYQFIKVENEDWGETPQSSDGYGLARHLLHVDFHGKKRWRAFVEFQSSLAFEKRDVSPLDEDPLEVHQLFIDYNLVVKPSSSMTLRLGRQELLYGSQRLVSVRNGPNNRQAFEGIKVLYASRHNNLDLFYSRFVVARPGAFNDQGEEAIRLWGVYGVKRHVLFLGNVDLYYLGLYKALAMYDDGKGRELRHSVGTRIWKQTNRLTFDIECLYQFGRLGEKSIQAWTVSFKSRYGLGGKLSPTIGIKTEIITGDRQYNDHKIDTFNPLFPSGAYFGLAALFGPANLIDFHPSLALTLSKKVEWNFDYDVFWRHNLDDGIYTNNMRLIYSGHENPYRFIGHQISMDVSYSPSRFISFSSEFKWFITGDYLKTAGEGEDILFGMLSMELTF